MSIYRIEVMRPADLDRAVGWAADEGWNPGLDDAACFWAADPTGFLVGRLDGRPIASISAVKYGRGYAFIGLYIVVPEMRGSGYGMRIWNAAVESVGDRVVGLDGVPEQQSNYRRSGFALAHVSTRYGGELEVAQPAQNHGVRDISVADLEAILAYDKDVFPDVRTEFLRQWLTGPSRSAKFVVRDGAITGYGVARRCRVGSKIGPLCAPSASRRLNWDKCRGCRDRRCPSTSRSVGLWRRRR